MTTEKEFTKTAEGNEQDPCGESVKKLWHSPRVTSLDSTLITKGISYLPGDGISNLSP